MADSRSNRVAFDPRWGAVQPSWAEEAEPIGKAVSERWVSPTQGLDLLTAAVCANILDNAAQARAGEL